MELAAFLLLQIMEIVAALVDEEQRNAVEVAREIIPTAALQDGKMFPVAETAELIKDIATDVTGQVLINV